MLPLDFARVAGLVVAGVLAWAAVRVPSVTERPSFWIALAGLAVAVVAGFCQ
jgi:hypothetical protein